MPNSSVSKAEIDAFLNGHDPFEKIVKIECDYTSDKVSIIYYDKNDRKKIRHEHLYPFCWAKTSAAQSLFNGNRQVIKMKLLDYGILCESLIVKDFNGNIHPRMQNGYNLIFRASKPMSYQRFMNFFREGGRPIYPREKDSNYGLREFMAVHPTEQFMIATGKRQFKGYGDYNDLYRLQFDLETEGLNPLTDSISQIGVRTNRGFERIISVFGEGEEKLNNEIDALNQFFSIIKDLKPDVISGHNTENFDWWFIDERLKLRGTNLETFTSSLFPHRGIYKSNKQKVLKLGGEMEYYTPTIMWGTNMTDSLFAVRRAQALNSNIKSANLKYITKFAKLNKPNRVYVPGKEIDTTWADDTKTYAHNDTNGKWFKITDDILSKTFDNNGVQDKKYQLTTDTLVDNESGDKYNIVTGTYIVQRYLLDDLYETDKVELSFNQTNFQISKMLPVTFEKLCTGGTAAIWKYMMMAWSYERHLAIPELIETKKFTGGLSRLLVTGYVDGILKLDYNSLYPSIILTHDISTPVDVMGSMSAMLDYMLTKREEYKGEKKKADKEVRRITAEMEEKPTEASQMDNDLKAAKSRFTLYDNMQMAIKVIANGFFGSFGSGQVFPWSDMECAEETTCTGRMALRLMIGHFTNLGYRPLVGDSFTGDTPLFVKYNKTDMIDIKPISELIDEQKVQIDVLGREYDFSEKGYKVLCRSGWVEPTYTYRHKADKDIYRVTENELVVDVTEDHSLYNEKKEEIKPTEITEDTKFEYYMNELATKELTLDKEEIEKLARISAKFKNKIPLKILNCNKKSRDMFLKAFDVYKECEVNIEDYSKTFVAGYNFIK